jgi:cytochrome c oxidase subunit 2
MTYERQNEVDPFVNADDDKIVNMEFHIPVNKPVNFQFRSQDVIHSAYMPHFRAQMNCVPGTKTRFHFTPTITTEEMREKTGNDEFNYLLYCNTICGADHYNMQMTIVVESQEDYEKWLSEQSTFTSVETAQSREEEKEVSEEEVLAEKN